MSGLSEMPASVQLAMMRAIGPRNRSYYVEKWDRYSVEGVKMLDWNWSALFFGMFWFAYRKMWLACLAYFFLLFPLYEILGRLAGPNAYLGAILIVKFLVVPNFANQIYYLYVRQ